MNRYSRLKALEDYGYDVNWSDLQSKSIAIAGVGGLGSIAAELLARLGVHTLHIFDLDIVEEINLNRLVYLDEHIGMTKVEALKQVLQKVNPDVNVIPHHGDIMSIANEDEFEEILASCDMGLLCLDNIPARQYFNVKCVNLNIPYMDAGLLRSGLGGYVHIVKPGINACYQCTGSMTITNTNDASGEQCSASIPTTVNIVASLQVQHVIKYFTNFGVIPDYISYNMLSDENQILTMGKDPQCFVCGNGKT